MKEWHAPVSDPSGEDREREEVSRRARPVRSETVCFQHRVCESTESSDERWHALLPGSSDNLGLLSAVRALCHVLCARVRHQPVGRCDA